MRNMKTMTNFNLTEKDKERFEAKIDKNGPTMSHMETCCWLWVAGLGSYGYGYFDFCRKGKKRRTGSHRVSYVLEYGEFENSLYICHKCDNPPCVRPDHLFKGTAKDNNIDARDKGRRGKLNFAIAHEIRIRLSTESITMRGICKEYGVSATQINYIKSNRSWPDNLKYDYSISEEYSREAQKCPGERNGSSKLTWDIVRRIRLEYASGEFTKQELVSKYNIIMNTQIHKILAYSSWDEYPHLDFSNAKINRKLTIEQIDEICKLKSGGMSGHKIAKEFGIPSTTLYRITRRQGKWA